MAEKIYGLLGRTLRHSFSVPIHRELGCEGYRLIELEPQELAGFLKTSDIGGLNVTIPYKREVMSHLDEISPRAEAIGSVNTIVRRGEKLCGHNTDADGFAFMASRLGVSFAGRKVLVFGSGGASVMVQYVAKEQGAAQVTVVSRSGEETYENLSCHYDAEILINTTPLGTYPDTAAYPADPALFPRCKAVLDLVYNPRRTALLQLAERAGIPCSDGLPMLVYQAKAAEELFSGTQIPDSEVLRILAQLRRETQNIVLIGMPGCGKSAVGALLANISGRRAVDLDAEIEKATGRSIPEIFAQDGEERFRALEREMCAKFGRESGLILITGGGVVLDERNYFSLHQNGRIYELLRDTAALSREGRPLSQSGNLDEMYSRRKPLYERFRDAALSNNGSAQNAAAELWRDYCENSCD